MRRRFLGAVWAVLKGGGVGLVDYVSVRVCWRRVGCVGEREVLSSELLRGIEVMLVGLSWS